MKRNILINKSFEDVKELIKNKGEYQGGCESDSRKQITIHSQNKT